MINFQNPTQRVGGKLFVGACCALAGAYTFNSLKTDVAGRYGDIFSNDVAKCTDVYHPRSDLIAQVKSCINPKKNPDGITFVSGRMGAGKSADKRKP